MRAIKRHGKESYLLNKSPMSEFDMFGRYFVFILPEIKEKCSTVDCFQFFKRIYNKVNPFPIYGGEETRAFCAVEDAVKATEIVMRSKNCNGEVIHIGNSSQEIKIIDLLKLVFDIADFHPQIEINPAPAGCVMRRCPNTDKLFKLTGFKATVTLEKALPKMFNWYEKKFGEI